MTVHLTGEFYIFYCYIMSLVIVNINVYTVKNAVFNLTPAESGFSFTLTYKELNTLV